VAQHLRILEDLLLGLLDEPGNQQRAFEGDEGVSAPTPTPARAEGGQPGCYGGAVALDLARGDVSDELIAGQQQVLVELRHQWDLHSLVDGVKGELPDAEGEECEVIGDVLARNRLDKCEDALDELAHFLKRLPPRLQPLEVEVKDPVADHHVLKERNPKVVLQTSLVHGREMARETCVDQILFVGHAVRTVAVALPFLLLAAEEQVVEVDGTQLVEESLVLRGVDALKQRVELEQVAGIQLRQLTGEDYRGARREVIEAEDSLPRGLVEVEVRELPDVEHLMDVRFRAVQPLVVRLVQRVLVADEVDTKHFVEPPGTLDLQVDLTVLRLGIGGPRHQKERLRLADVLPLHTDYSIAVVHHVDIGVLFCRQLGQSVEGPPQLDQVLVDEALEEVGIGLEVVVLVRI